MKIKTEEKRRIRRRHAAAAVVAAEEEVFEEEVDAEGVDRNEDDQRGCAHGEGCQYKNKKEQ